MRYIPLKCLFILCASYITACAQVKFIYANNEDKMTIESTSTQKNNAQALADTLPNINLDANNYTITPSNSTPQKEVAFVIRSQSVAPPTTTKAKTKPTAKAANLPVEPKAAALETPPIVLLNNEEDTIAINDADIQRIKVYPPNDVAQNSDLQDFIKQLLIASKTKDAEFISNIIHPDIMFGDMGGYDYGKYPFIGTWRITDPDSPFWLYLEKALKIGGAYYHNPATDEIVKDEWVFPYICNMEIDPAFMYSDVLVITHERANVRTKPDLKAPVIAKFSNDLVKVDYAQSVLPSQKQALKGVSGRGEKDWYRVSSLDGKINGYVNWLVAWNPRGLRFQISKSLDKWYIKTWIGSGD